MSGSVVILKNCRDGRECFICVGCFAAWESWVCWRNLIAITLLEMRVIELCFAPVSALGGRHACG